MFLDLQILNTIDLVKNAQHSHKEDVKRKLALRKAKDKQKDLVNILDPIKEDKTDMSKKDDNLPMKEDYLLECDNCLKKGEDVKND